MQSSILIAALTVFATSVTATPKPQSSPKMDPFLARRQGDGRPEAIAKFSYCNGCVPDTSGGASCTQTIYSHFGYGSYGNCDDTASVFSASGSYCDTLGAQVDTPAGKANWVAADSCSDTAADYTKMGELQAPGNVFYECYKWSQQWDDYCLGVDYACTIGMYCY